MSLVLFLGSLLVPKYLADWQYEGRLNYFVARMKGKESKIFNLSMGIIDLIDQKVLKDWFVNKIFFF